MTPTRPGSARLAQTLERLALVVALVVLGAGPSRAEPAPETAPVRLAVASAPLPPDPAGTCLVFTLMEGLTESLAARLPARLVLDRALVRTLEREQVGLEAEVVRLALEGGPGARRVTLESPEALRGRTLSADDPAAVIDTIVVALGGAARPGDEGATSMPEPACAALARAWAAFDPGSDEALARAQRELEGARRAAPDDPRVLAALAEVLTRRGESARALELAERAVALAPDRPEASWALGLALDYAGRVDEALAAYRRSLARAPAITAARINAGLLELRAGRVAPALDDLGRARAAAPRWQLAALNLAVALVEAGDGRAALAALDAIDRAGPHAPRAALVEVRARLLAGEPEAASQRARGLLAEGATDPILRVTLGRAQLALGDPAAALATLDEALAAPVVAPPASGVGQSLAVSRARALVALGRVAEARDGLRALVTADAERDLALVRRAMIVLGWGDGETLESLVARHPHDHEAWYDLGVLRAGRGQRAEAREALVRAAEANPRAAWARYNLGVLALEQGLPAEAIPWLEEARRIEPAADDIAAALAAARARVSP